MMSETAARVVVGKVGCKVVVVRCYDRELLRMWL